MLLNRTHSVSRPEELRPSTQQPIQQQQQYQPYHQTMQPFYGLSTMGYYPVIGGTQRSNGKKTFSYCRAHAPKCLWQCVVSSPVVNLHIFIGTLGLGFYTYYFQ